MTETGNGPRIIALYGSPRAKGNTDLLLDEVVRGAEEAGAHVEPVYLRKMRMAACMACYNCAKEGICALEDDFTALESSLMNADGVAFSSPIFFYTVTAHAKIFMDRCQVYWERRYVLKRGLERARPGVFVGVGATNGACLFEGTLLTMKYFYDAIDVSLIDTLLVRGIEKAGDIAAHEERLIEARRLGAKLARDARHANAD